MKNNTLKIACCLVFALCLNGCNNFLDEVPKSEYTQIGTGEENLKSKYASLSDAEAELQAAYESFKNDIFQLENYLINDVQSDNCYVGGDGTNEESVDLLKLTSTNVKVGFVWGQYLSMASAATSVIENTKLMDAESISETNRTRLIAEAKFIRAWAYFDMVRLWGGLPMILKIIPTITANNINEIYPLLYPERTPEDEVYAQIISDLSEENTIKYLDSKKTGTFKATKGAAYGLLAKVLATRGDKSARDYTQVIKYCDKTIGLGYQLVKNFDDLWKADNKFTTESIFEVYYTTDAPNWAYWTILKEMDDGTVTWRRYCTPTQDLLSKFDKVKDTRYTASIIWKKAPYDVYYPSSNYPFSNKIREKNSNIILMRLADILLLKAEAMVEINKSAEAIDIVNKIRERAGLGAYSLDKNMSQNEARLAVENERQLELYMEAQRWYDLLRNNRMIEVMTKHKDKNGKLLFPGLEAFRAKWPVPQTERDMNVHLTQNEGY